MNLWCMIKITKENFKNKPKKKVKWLLKNGIKSKSKQMKEVVKNVQYVLMN